MDTGHFFFSDNYNPFLDPNFLEYKEVEDYLRTNNKELNSFVNIDYKSEQQTNSSQRLNNLFNGVNSYRELETKKYSEKVRWSLEEEKKLCFVAKKYTKKENKWAKIAEKLGTGRTAKACERKAYDLHRLIHSKQRKYAPWTREEEHIIKEFAGKITWKSISLLMSNRSPEVCRHKYYKMRENKNKFAL